MDEWIQLTPEEMLVREPAYYRDYGGKWPHAVKAGKLGYRTSLSTPELIAIPLVAELVEMLENAVSAMMDLGAPLTLCELVEAQAILARVRP